MSAADRKEAAAVDHIWRNDPGRGAAASVYAGWRFRESIDVRWSDT